MDPGALNMALQQRRPEQVIHHGDQGSQYTSLAFGNRGRQMGVRPSIRTVGDAFDNAMAESFFANLECELIDRKTSKPVPRPAWQCSPGLKAGTTPGDVTAPGYLSPFNLERGSDPLYP